LNKFPAHFAVRLGRELVFLLATRQSPRLEGQDWEEIFSRLIGADWENSNVGLDDVRLEQCAWGCKTVKVKIPSAAKTVRLISGRNSPIFSFGDGDILNQEPSLLGEKVLAIWNERVSAIKKNFKYLRTVVLVKSEDLLEVAVFELETIRFEPERISWEWNKSKNLEGFDENRRHRFTWQPHGSQFTIIEKVPEDRLALKIEKPPLLDRDRLLDAIGFDNSWLKVL